MAIICSNYEQSKRFYTELLGMEVLREVYRKDRASYKLDLALNGVYMLELFSFPSPPKRTSRPEAVGLRHLAFAVSSVDAVVQELASQGVVTEPVRTDDFTGKKFTFFFDPDGLPLELYEL